MSVRKRHSSGKLVVLNEEELIQQVHLRPLLYDRSLKSYRKASLRKQYWLEVSKGMDATVEECRKRWRSLRDSFAKHYKQIQRTEDEHVRKKHRKWVFYEQMSFMIPYLDSSSYELDDQLIEEYGDNSDDGESVSCVPQTTDIVAPQETQQSIKLSESVSEHQHNNHDNVQQNTVSVQATDFMPIQEESIIMESHQHEQPNNHQSDFKRKDTYSNSNNNNTTNLSSHSELDADERFLLSCAPTLRRLTNRQNSMARLQIQQILFDIEFGERRTN